MYSVILVSVQNEVKITIISLQFLKVTLLHAKGKCEKQSFRPFMLSWLYCNQAKSVNL